MLRAIQLGAIAVVLAVTTFFAFELDRFFVPKELVLHLTALIAGVIAVRRIQLARRDWLLAAWIGVSVLSAVFAANPWLAFRALAISASGVLLYWTARVVGARAINAVAFAVVLVAVTSLLQTYGVDTTLFSENRAPGGTLGNRNFVAHAAAFGFPVLLLAVLRAQRLSRVALGAAGVAIVTASLVLTRSRAAWLAFAAVMVVFLVGMVVAGNAQVWRRFAAIVAIAGGGVAAALLIPNTLRWRSDNPYVETLQRVTNYQEGSGRGRLIQYEHSLRMAAHHPLLGVGPGNWAVEYPAHAARRDPSMSDNDGGMTTNPWPSSDWVAMVSERGPAAAVLLAVFLGGLAIDALRRLRSDEGLIAAALLATLAGAVVAGAFDAVLLLALPTFLVWTAMGALSVQPVTDEHLPQPPKPVAAIVTAAALVVLSAAGVYRSASQIAAMQIYSTRGDRGSLARAVRIDPGNYRLQVRLARMGNRRQRCEHALAARALYPHAETAAALSRGCD